MSSAMTLLVPSMALVMEPPVELYGSLSTAMLTLAAAIETPALDPLALPTFSADLVRMTIVLASIVAIMFGLARVLRRLGIAGAVASADHPRHGITILSSARLDARHRVHVIRAAGRVIVIGAWPEGIAALSNEPVDADASADCSPDSSEEAGSKPPAGTRHALPSRTDFYAQLAKMGRRGAGGFVSTTSAANPDVAGRTNHNTVSGVPGAPGAAPC